VLAEMKTEWFEQTRYGHFIHFGIFSMHGRGEWVVNKEEMVILNSSVVDVLFQRFSMQIRRLSIAVRFDAPYVTSMMKTVLNSQELAIKWE
jgi:hypothetical protein